MTGVQTCALPIFVFEDPNHDLNISFGLVNDSDIIADTDFGSWKILINGQNVPDSHWIFGNGPGPAGPGGWERLPAREAFIFGKAFPIGKYFPKPGTYEVAWKGSRFSARPAIVGLVNSSWSKMAMPKSDHPGIRLRERRATTRSCAEDVDRLLED